MQRTIFYGALLAVTANFFWAANAIVGKVVVSTLPAFTLSQFRWLLAFILILPFGLPHIISQMSWYKSNLKPLFVLSVLSVTFYNTFQYWALEYTEPVNVGALLALMPLAIAVASGLFGGVKQTGLQWLTTAFAVMGSLIVVTKGQLLSLFSQNGTGAGELLMVAAISSWAVYSVLLGKLPHDGIKLVGLLTFFIGVGTLCIAPFWLFNVLYSEVSMPSAEHGWAILFVAIFPSIVSYFCWNTAIRMSGAVVAGLMVTTAPLFNALLSMIYLDSDVLTVQWVGIAIVVAGVSSTLMLSRKPKPLTI